jgi:CBS domain-containing protein
MTANPYSLEIEQIERELQANKDSMYKLLQQVQVIRNKQEQQKLIENAAPPVTQTSNPQTTGIQNLQQIPNNLKKQGGKAGKSQDLLAEQEFERKGRRPRALTLDTRAKLLQNPPKRLKDVLEKFCLQELALAHWLEKRPILVGDFQTLERALSRINAHEIRSLPVVDKNKIVIGLIDIIDITRSIAESLRTMGDVHAQTSSFQPGKFRNDFMSKTVGSLLAEKKTKAYVAANHVSILLATQYLVATNQERFMIVDREVEGNVSEQKQPEEYLDGLITQSDVIKFLAQNSVLMRQEPLFQKTLRELNLGQRKPLILSHSEISSDAFIEMADKGFDSAAVVDDSGKLIANISAADLKGLTRRNCVILSDPLDNFLNRDWRRGWWAKPICVDLNDPLFFVVLQFVSSKVHRMYIVDNEGKPIGEVNHLDILKILLKIG